jgi:hypothetical protein
MRRLLIVLAILLVPSVAIARGHGGGGGGSGGHGGGWGGHGGGWSGGRSAASFSGARMSGPARVSSAAVMGGNARMAAGMGTWKGSGNWKGNWNGNWAHNGHRHHFRNRVFFVGGGPWWWGDYGYYDAGCWQWIETRRGLRRVWACGDLY